MEENKKDSAEWWDLLIDGDLFVSISGRLHAERFLNCMQVGADQPNRYTLEASRLRKVEEAPVDEMGCNIAAVRPW